MSDPFGSFSYALHTTPSGYVCATCDRHGVKLWRPPHSNRDLQCAACCETTASLPAGSVDEDGTHRAGFGRTDQVNGFVPCVPAEDGSTSWGYSSVPPYGLAWWQGLPLRHAPVSDASKAYVYKRQAESLRLSVSQLSLLVTARTEALARLNARVEAYRETLRWYAEEPDGGLSGRGPERARKTLRGDQ